MPTFIEIEGGIARVVERSVSYEAPLEEALDLLEKRPPIILPSLPRNRIAAINWDERDVAHKKIKIAVAIPPAIRLLPLAPGYATDDLPPRVALPWTVILFGIEARVVNPRHDQWQMNDIRFYFTPEEPDGSTQNLIPALLPNVYSTATICWGDTGVPANQPLRDRIDQVANEFYHTQFTHGGDDPYGWPYYKRTYKKWARETAAEGATSYRNWPDWTDDRRRHFTMAELLELNLDRNQPIVLLDGIPELSVHPTFGMAEQWYRGLTPLQRQRLTTAITTANAEDPTLTELPRDVIAQLAEEDDD